MNPNSFKIPPWLQDTTGELQDTYNALPGAYDTSAYANTVGASQQQNLARGLRSGESMSRVAASRAARAGGQVASSFAAGGALLPIYEQNAAMDSNLANLRLNASMAQAQARAQLAGNLSSARQGQQGMVSSFFNASADRQQQGSQFDRNLAQNESQFGRNLTQQGSQFDRSLSQSGSQFDRTYGLQQQQVQQQGTNARFAHLQAALGMTPPGRGSYSVNAGGNPSDSISAVIKSRIDQQNAQRQNLMNQFYQAI